MLDEPSQQLRAQDIAGPAAFARASATRREQIRVAHIRIFYELSHLAAFVSLGLALLIAANLYGRVPTPALLAWSGALVTVALLRYSLGRRFARAQPSDREMPLWGRRAWIGSLVQALLWCLLLPLATYSDRSADLFATFFLMCALGFGAFATLGFYQRAYLAFSLPILAAIFFWFLYYVPEVTGWIGLLLIIGCTVMSRAGLRATRVLRGALLLGFEREDWVRAAKAEKERMQVTLQAIGDGVISTDIQGRVGYANASAERLTGRRGAAILGRPLDEVLVAAEARALPDLLALCLERGEPVTLEGERLIAAADGGEACVQISAAPLRDPAQGVVGVVVVLHDVTELSGLAREISYRAEHDSLTGLINRQAFARAIAEAMEYSRSAGGAHAVCYIDLDQFKIVNDTCGHSAGDELLKNLAERLRAHVREGDLLARLGGDEFGLLLRRCPLTKAREVAESIAQLIREYRFEWDGKLFSVGVSVGLVPFDGAGTPEQVLGAADAACYVAKDQGRNRLHIADVEDGEVASRHGEMRQTTQIQEALDQGRFRLRLQKIVPLQAVGAPKAEFLLSMADRDGQLLAPGLFLPAAERFNMMPRLDRHVVRLALEHVMSGQPELSGIDAFTINLSGQSLAEEGFLDYVLGELRTSGVQPRRICFEITETAVISNLDRALRFMARLREAGCQFALDDFGAGLSSFGYLRRLPVDYLKIDGQFVQNMGEDPVNRAIVEAINEVGQIMGLKTVAEFVEDEPTRRLLQEMGVDYAQGWGLHRPDLLPRLERSGNAA